MSPLSFLSPTNKPKTALSKLTEEDLKAPGQKAGKEFQSHIKVVCDLYEKLGIAYIQEFNLSTLFIPSKSGGQGQMIYRAKTGFDFIGGIISTGRAVFIEVKTTKEGRIVIEEKHGIRLHQLHRMCWLEEQGLDCFFLWEIRNATCVYKFKPSQVCKVIEGRVVKSHIGYVLQAKKSSLNIMDADDSGFIRLMRTEYKGGSYVDFLGVLE